MDGQRLDRMTHNARGLADAGHLRNDITVQQAGEIMWTYSSAQLYELLVVIRGWPLERYGTFLADAMIAALLPPEQPPPAPPAEPHCFPRQSAIGSGDHRAVSTTPAAQNNRGSRAFRRRSGPYSAPIPIWSRAARMPSVLPPPTPAVRDTS